MTCVDYFIFLLLKEMEKHPFFMKKAPEPGDEIHPMLEGLQQLKFDTEDNTPFELAEKYKEDGNYWIKHKKFRIAIMNYTEALQQKLDDSEMNASLYNNRSAAHFFLKNYRSSICDAELALRQKRNYPKVKIRLLKCKMELKKYEEVCKHVEEFLSEDPTNKELIDIQKVAIAKKAEILRNERKNQLQEKKKRQEFQTLVQALIQRKAKFEEIRHRDLSSSLTPEIIKPKIDPLENHSVSIDSHGTVYWPIVFCYPEYQLTDIQQQVHEMETIFECFEDMFALDEPTPHNYKNPNDLNVYFENRLKATVYKVDLQKTIKDLVADEKFSIFNGYITLYAIPKDSKAETEFVNQKRRPLL